jgi:hypothetical protein
MALAFVAGSSAKADAAFLLAICDTQFCGGGNSILVFDNGAGDLNGGAGRIAALEGGIGGFNQFDIETALSQPRNGVGTTPLLDITYSVTGTGNAWIYASDTDFTGPASSVFMQNDGNNSGGSVTTAVASLYGGNSNNNPISPLIGSITGLDASGSFPFAPGVDPYGLTLEFHIVSSGTTTGDLSAEVVPEPVSMTLFGLGLLGTGIARRRRII